MPSPRRLFVLDGHPAPDSLSAHFAQSYGQAAGAAGHEVRHAALSAMAFDPDFGATGFRDPKPLEPALVGFMADLAWAEHLVVLSPMWWGGMPAKLKGLFDRAFLPGAAFDPRIRKNHFPLPLLTGKTARFIVTSDTPPWFQRWIYRDAMGHQFRHQIAHFCGLKPARLTHFGPVETADAARIATWRQKVERLGAAGA